MEGVHGKILRVDLSKGETTREDLPEDIVKKYLGGSGIGTYYLFTEVGKGADPLGPENELIFMTGPLTGTRSPSAGRYTIISKSPLTGFWGQSNSAGRWGVDFKRTGFDGVIFQGISKDPVYLVVDDGAAELKDANGIMGESVSETTETIKQDLGKKFNVACIGEAGENLVKYACIMNDVGRAAGRCGMGAVMGSKNLKAIAAQGTKEIKIADADAFEEASNRAYDRVNESLLKATTETYGTAMAVDLVNVRGGFPTRNWQTGVFPNVDKINGTAIVENILKKRKACFACPIKCGRISQVEEGKYKCEGEGPEYESIGALGGMCDIDNLEAITKAHLLCNEYGLDVISAGSTIGFAMECYERGILTDAETNGLEIEFGDPDIMIELLQKIARREGVGDLLAEGTKRMSEELGQGTEKFAMHVKGLELPAYDSRAIKITGLAHATANRGGCHITGYIHGPAFLSMPFLVVRDARIQDPFKENPDEAEYLIEFENTLAVFDAVGTCKFMGLALTREEWSDILSSATGLDIGPEEWTEFGERIYNLERLFNIREGLTRVDDTLPPRMLEEPLPEGPAEGDVVNLKPMLDAYYEFRSWDKEKGEPTLEKLEELGLEEYSLD